MTFDDVMRELEAAGSEQTRKTYRRHGVPEPMFGVSYAKLGELKKRIKRDQPLAERLWASGVHDARVLAAMVADPAMFGPTVLDDWVRATGYHALACTVGDLVAATPHAHGRAEAWIDEADEIVAAIGWGVLARLSADATLPDEAFARHLPRIEREIHGAKNRTKEAMNSALIAFGGRSDGLAETAIAAARRIGKVDVDHGDTDCKTPLAEPYILKMRERARAKAAKAAKPAKAAR